MPAHRAQLMEVDLAESYEKHKEHKHRQARLAYRGKAHGSFIQCRNISKNKIYSSTGNNRYRQRPIFQKTYNTHCVLMIYNRITGCKGSKNIQSVAGFNVY